MHREALEAMLKPQIFLGYIDAQALAVNLSADKDWTAAYPAVLRVRLRL